MNRQSAISDISEQVRKFGQTAERAKLSADQMRKALQALKLTAKRGEPKPTWWIRR